MFISYLLGFFVFVLGLCIGSFLNCVIYRLEQEKSLKGRSFCPHCKHALSWQDLFPVFSFLFLLGKCRYCRAKISIQYPLVEIATGLIFLLIFSAQGANALGRPASGVGPAEGWNFLYTGLLFYVASALIIIFVYDLKHYLIPDKILFPAIVTTFLYRLFGIWDLGFGNSAGFSNFILAAIIASGFFFIIWLVSGGKWMGFGDVKLAVLMGFLLGLPNVLVALFLAFFFGAIIGLILMVFNKKSLKSEIPFGPFLIVGTFLAMTWGSQIIHWYLNFFKI